MRTLLILAAVSMFGVGCKKKSAASAAPEPAPSGGNTNYVPGNGAIQNVRQAARRTVALNDMHQLGQMIEVAYSETGKMPTPQQIKASLAQAQSILAHIEEGNIILTGTTDHAGLWAYEVDGNLKGGVVLQA